MERLVIVPFMLVVLFSSCSKQENPLTPVDPQNTSVSYLGEIGTQRVYEEVVKWYMPNTEIPFIIVPDTLMDIVKFSREELKQGIVSKNEITQTVDSIPFSYYTQWNLPHPYLMYKQLNGRGVGYELYTHLRAISE